MATRDKAPPVLAETVTSPSVVAGAVSGNYTTGHNGNASYQIPIDVPPGIRGMEPGLALVYDSQSSNALLGVGWQLSGMSSIRRCKQTPAVDGVRGTITYTGTDAYCLDGQRLINVSGGYGSPGSVYRTELETWRKVVASQDACGSGPCSFTVTTEQGNTLRYGSSASTRAAPTGKPGEVRVWALAQTQDLDGNTLSITYSQAPIAGTSAADGQLYAVRMDYTSNGSVQANRSVRFAYEPRTDVITQYMGGSPVVTRARLTHVTTYLNDTPVKDYQLGYRPGNSTATGRSEVQSVTVCAGSGTPCLKPTVFQWQDVTELSFQTTSLLAQLSTSSSGVWNMDVNGDGRGDLVSLDTSQPMNAYAYLFDGSSLTACGNPSSVPGVSSQLLQTGDANGDGRGDLLQLWPSSGRLNVTAYLSNPAACGFLAGNTSTPTQPGGAPVPFTTTFYPMDVNGDGRTDLVLVYPDGPRLSLLTLLSSGSGTFSGYAYGGSVTIPSPSGSGTTGVSTLPMDVNGDGMSDLVLAVVSSGKLELDAYLSTGTAFSSQAVTTQPGVGVSGTLKLWQVDINGDGLMDVVQGWVDGSSILHLQPFAATGDGSFAVVPETNTGRSGTDFKAFWPMDINGDGRTDLVQGWNNGQGRLSVVVYRNTGAGFDTGTVTGTTLSADVTNTFAVDLDANGKTDLLQGGKTLTFYGALVQGPAPDLVSTITEGGGGQIALTYAPLSDASVYKAGAAADALVPSTGAASLSCATAKLQAGYPFTNALAYNFTQAPAQAPFQVVGGGLMYLVKQATEQGTDPSAAYAYTTRYQYGDAVVDRSGRGWLGFRVLSKLDPTGTRAVNVFNQPFPLTGTLAQVVYACDASSKDPRCAASPQATLSGSQTCYAPAVTATGVSATAPKVYQVQKTQTKSDTYDYGTYASSQLEAYAYDTCGQLTLSSNLGAVSATGKDLSSSDNVYTCSAYWNTACATSSNPSTWLFNDATAVKVSTRAACTDFGSFTDNVDLSLTTTAYSTDGRMHVLSTGNWDNTHKVSLTTSYGYDGFGNTTSVTKPGGGTTTSTYEGTWNTYVDTVTSPPNVDNTRLVQRFGHDPRFGLQVATTEANGNTNITCLDAFGRTVGLQGPVPAGVTGTKSQCVPSNVTGSGASGFASAQTVSLQDSQWSITSSGGLMQTLSVAQSWPGAGSSAATQWTHNYVDGQGRIYKSVQQGPAQSGNIVTCTLYDSRGRPVQQSIPQYFQGEGPACVAGGTGPGLWLTRSYDAYGRPLQQAQPSGPQGTQTSKTQYAYSGGDTVTITYAAGSADQYQKVFKYQTFNSERRAVQMVLPADGNATTTYGYDVLGRLKQVTDPKTAANPSGVTNTVQYDSLGRRTVSDNPDQNTTGSATVKAATYRYSPTNGQLATATDAKGQQTSFRFDAMGRMTGTTYADGTTVTWSYDSPTAANGLGRLTHVEARSAGGQLLHAYDYAYDPYGNRTSVTSTIDGLAQPLVTQRQYDPLARVTTLTYADGTVLNRTYSGGNLSALAIGATTYAAFSNYTAMGSPQAVQYGNGAAARYTYAPQGGLNQQRITDSTQAPLLDQTVQWDLLTRVTGVVDNLKPGGLDSSQAFTYQNGRLSQAVAAGLYGTRTYGYDASGNLTSNAGVTLSYQAHRAATGTQAGQTDPVYQATYDANGNLLTRADTSTHLRFTYDAANHLTGITNSDSGTQLLSRLLYDQDGKRVRKVDANGVTSFYPDPSLVVTQYKGAVQYTRYVHGEAGTVAALTTVQSGTVTRVPSGTPSPGTLYFHTDHLGSTSLVTDVNGRKQTQMVYLPYGGVLLSKTTGPDNFIPKFQATESDEIVNLYYFGARYYDPAAGRFTSPDTQLASHIFQTDAFNRFAFAVNNPVTYIDPTGHSVWEAIAGFAIGLAEVVAGVAIDVLSDGALEPLGGALIGAGTNGMMYSAQNGSNFSWKQYGIQQGMGAALGVLTGGFGGEAAAGEEVAVEEGTLAVRGEASAAAQSERAVSLADGTAMETGTKGTSELGGSAESDALDTVEEGCENSFVAGTLVSTGEGLRPIETLAAGDEVWSYDERGQTARLSTVTRLFHHLSEDGVVELEAGGETLVVTPSHRLWVEGRGWAEAERIGPGERLRTLAGETVPVRRAASVAGAVDVYNIQVQRTHNYYVSLKGFLVHNPKGMGLCDVGGNYNYGKTRAERGMVESNHFPASSSYSGTPYDAVPVGQRPAVNMDYVDHLETESWGSSYSAQAWRAKQTQLMNSGNFAKAMEMDILDMKAITKASTGDANYLSSGMQEAVDYAAQPNKYLGHKPFISPAEHSYLSKLIWK